jgi:DNA-binding CsgD family transcriptional regulator
MRQQVEQAIRLAVGSTSLDDLAQSALPPLAQAFGVSSLILYIQEANGFRSWVPAGLPDQMQAYGALAAKCPLLQVKQRFNPLVAVITDLVDARTFRRSEMFNEVFHPAGLDRQLVARLSEVPAGRTGTRGVVLCRSKRDREWSRDDEEVLRRVQPILTAAVERNARWEGMRRERDVLSSVLRKTEATPMLLYGSDGRLLWMSRRATELLSASLGRRKDLDEPFREAALSLLQLGDGGELPQDIHLELATRGPGPSLRAGVFCSRTEGDELFVTVALLEENAPPESLPLDPFGFSKAELAVVRELLTGAGTREIAARLFVSQATVRTHLKHVYDKADVHSRVELVVKLRGR